jgi:hypothetical protein
VVPICTTFTFFQRNVFVHFWTLTINRRCSNHHYLTGLFSGDVMLPVRYEMNSCMFFTSNRRTPLSCSQKRPHSKTLPLHFLELYPFLKLTSARAIGHFLETFKSGGKKNSCSSFEYSLSRYPAPFSLSLSLSNVLACEHRLGWFITG